MTQNDDLDELLDSAQKTKKTPNKPEDIIPRKIKFTKGAFEKSDMIGPLVKELTDTDYEWSAFLLAQKGDKDYAVRDIHIQKGQDIRNRNVVISGEDITKANNTVQEINKQQGTNQYIIGWIHGHGDGGTTPSTVDLNNFKIVLNSTSLNTEQSIKTPLRLIETSITRTERDGKVIFSGEELGDAIVEHSFEVDQRIISFLEKSGINLKDKKGYDREVKKLFNLFLDSTRTDYYQPTVFGFAYYVIMSNLHLKPYAGVAFETSKMVTKTKSSKLLGGLEIDIIQSPTDIEVTKKDLEAEIKKNIDLPRKFHYFGFPFTTSYPISSRGIISGKSSKKHKRKGLQNGYVPSAPVVQPTYPTQGHVTPAVPRIIAPRHFSIYGNFQQCLDETVARVVAKGGNLEELTRLSFFGECLTEIQRTCGFDYNKQSALMEDALSAIYLPKPAETTGNPSGDAVEIAVKIVGDAKNG